MVIRAGFPRKFAGDALLKGRVRSNQEKKRVEWKVQRAQGREESICRGPIVVGTEDPQGIRTGDR